MVVPMKRLELLLYHKERDQFLESLRSLGVVHIVQSEETGDTAHNQQLQNLIRRCEKVIGGLRKIAADEKTAHSGDSQKASEAIIEEYEAFEAENDKLSQELLSLSKDYAQLEPWGSFDPSMITKLGDAGVAVRFYVMSKKKFEELDTSKLTVVRINEKESDIYFVIIDYGAVSSIPTDEVRLPEESIDQLNNRIAELKGRQVVIAKTQAAMVGYLPQLEAFRNEKENELRYERARSSMAAHAEGRLLHLTGWFPLEKQNAVEKFLGKYAAWFTTRDPLPEDDVPVKLKNTAFAKLFEPITGLYSLPHFTELDTTPFMAPFFSIFFGLCLGDLGYGLIVLIASLVLLFKMGPKIRPFAMLGVVLGSATVISGVLLNSFFGQAIFGGPGVENAFISSGVQIFSPLASTVSEKGQVFPAMSLALVLGFVQIIFGMILQAFIRAANGGLIAGIQPVASIMMIVGSLAIAADSNFLNLGIGEFTVGPVLVGKMLLAIPLIVAKVLTWGGLVLFFFFNNVDKKFFIRPAVGLWEFYQFVTGILGDVLSYLRLFALGLAGGLLGAAFNQIAFMFVTGPDGTVNYASAGIIGTVAVLVIGHTLNIALSLIGSFVHPLRLTFVEFYKNIGFKGGSKPFVPFSTVK